MLDVADIEVFILIAQNGSLSATARQMNVTPAAVSYRLVKLEKYLGTRLFHRTTRRLTLTQDGTEYLAQVEPLLNEIKEVSSAASRRDELPQGVLRVTMPASFALKHITPIMPRFLKRYPQVQLSLALNDEIVDIVSQGFDVAIRICALEDSDL